MARPNILPATLGPSIEIDGVDLHDLGVLLHTIDPRGMPPVTPNRHQAARHGAVIGDEYYTPSPLVISGQMVADSHADLISHQRQLTSLLYRRSFRLIDNLSPGLYRDCIYDGRCAFGDASPRRSGTSCTLSFSVLANPPWLQAAAPSHVTIPRDGTNIIENSGNVPAEHLITLQPNARTSIFYAREAFRFVPNYRYYADIASTTGRVDTNPYSFSNGFVSTLNSSDLSLAPPSGDSTGLVLPLVSGNGIGALGWRFTLGYPIHPHCAVHMVISPRRASGGLGRNRRGLFYLRNNAGGGVLSATMSSSTSHPGASRWQIQNSNGADLIIDPGPSWSAGDALDVWVSFGDKIQLFVGGQLAGEKVQANANLTHAAYRLWVGHREGENRFSLDADLKVMRILPYAPTAEQRRDLSQYPNKNFTALDRAIFSLPSITDSRVQFDARGGTYAGVGRRLFPDTGTSVPALRPGRTLIGTDGAAGDVTITYREGFLA